MLFERYLHHLLSCISVTFTFIVAKETNRPILPGGLVVGGPTVVTTVLVEVTYADVVGVTTALQVLLSTTFLTRPRLVKFLAYT